MKWKTSTIITILVVSIGIVGFSQYEKMKSIETLESEFEARVKEEIVLEKKKIENQFEEQIKTCNDQNEALKKEKEE